MRNWILCYKYFHKYFTKQINVSGKFRVYTYYIFFVQYFNTLLLTYLRNVQRPKLYIDPFSMSETMIVMCEYLTKKDIY